MSIHIHCTRCRCALSVPARQAGHPMFCPRCHGESIIPTPSPNAPRVRKTAPSEVRAATAVDPSEIAPDWTEPPTKPLTRRTLVAVSIVSLLLVAAAWTSIAVWSQWKHLANPNEARVDESRSDPAERAQARRADPATPLQALNSENSEDANLPQAEPGSGAPEEDETPKAEVPQAEAPVAKPPSDRVAPAAAGKLVVTRRNDLSEEDLRKQLLWAPELSMTPADIPPLVEAFLANVASAKTEQRETTFEPTYITARLPEFKTLPYRRGVSHLLEGKAVRELHVLGRELHVILDQLAAKEGQTRTSAVLLGEFMKAETRADKKYTWLRPEAVPAMQQVLGHEDLPVRLLLVELLTRIEGRAASLALVQHAVFDLSPEVRDAAIKGLASRPREQFRSALVAAMRYPWAPAADHAAEALVALKDSDAAPLLVKLLKEPDPAAPVAKKDRLWKHEVVRINHTDNCLACHPPAWLGNDPVQRAVPGFTLVNKSTVVATASLPVATQTIIESGGTVKVPSIKPAERSGGYPHGPTTTTTSATSLAVRGDITYLRQDFSIQQPVPVAAAAQSVNLRFDYLVRLRPLTEKQTHEWKSQANKQTVSDQREAVLFALRELTGQDPGAATEAWEKLYPQSDFEALTAELTTALVGAPDFQKLAVIKKLRDAKVDAKADAHSAALAQAIPQLTGILPDKARTALTERLKRMNRETLRERLADDNREIRLAAASAAGRKGEKDLIPDLTTLLADPDPAVADAAQTALKTLRGQETRPEGGGD